jgi:hypothetical protein
VYSQNSKEKVDVLFSSVVSIGKDDVLITLMSFERASQHIYIYINR